LGASSGRNPGLAFLITMKLWFMLTEEDKEKLAQVYKNLTGKKLRPPVRDKQIVHYETKIESLPELGKLMKETQNYPIDVQGRV
jgi:hypothetical protein